MDDIGEVYFLAKCMELGLSVSKPFKPMKYDFIVDNGTDLLKVQCKRTASSKTTQEGFDTYYLKCASGSKQKQRYTKEQIDILAIYCDPIGVWYIIPIEDAGEKLSMYLYPHRSLLGDFSVGQHEAHFNRWVNLTNPRRAETSKQ